MNQNSSKMPWELLSVAVILNFVTWAVLFSIPPMEALISEDLVISHFQAGLLFTIPILMIALAAIPAGVFADRAGIKKVIGIGAIIALIGALLRGMATGYHDLLLFSLIFGLGMGLTFANLPKLARSCSKPEEILLVMGILTGFGVLGGVGVSLAITVPLLYPLTNSYHGVFYFWSALLVIITVLWWVVVREPPCPHIGVVQEKVSFSEIKKTMKSRVLWLLAFILFLHNFFFYTWSGWVPTYLLEKGISLGTADLMTSVMLWVGVPTVLLVPVLLSGRDIPRKLFVWGPSVIYAFLAGAILYAGQFSLWLLMVIAGVINILRFNTLLTLPVEIMPKEHAGTASGVVVSIGYMGAVVGPLVAGQILDITGTLQSVFVILIVLSVITTLFAFLIPSNSNKKAFQKV
jgi:CP family cyanate transporter-like MFS transporter